MIRNKGFHSIFKESNCSFSDGQENHCENEIVHIDWNSDDNIEDPNKSKDFLCRRSAVTTKRKRKECNILKCKSLSNTKGNVMPEISSKLKRVLDPKSPTKLLGTPAKKAYSSHGSYAAAAEDILIEWSDSSNSTIESVELQEIKAPTECGGSSISKQIPALHKSKTAILGNNAKPKALNMDRENEQITSPATIFRLHSVASTSNATGNQNVPDDLSIEWDESRSPPHSANSTESASQIIEMTMETQEFGAPTELDLLLDLIEREEKKEETALKARNKKPRTRCRKDGFLNKLHQKLHSTKADSRFLEYDKRYGLLTGTAVRVIDVRESFGAYLATVRIEQQDQCFEDTKKSAIMQCVLYPDMAKKVKVGSRLEVFFDKTFEPYKLVHDGEEVQTFVQPHKILFLE